MTKGLLVLLQLSDRWRDDGDPRDNNGNGSVRLLHMGLINPTFKYELAIATTTSLHQPRHTTLQDKLGDQIIHVH